MTAYVILGLNVICLKSWPFSAMISANNWLERRIETSLDVSFCLIMWFLRNLADQGCGILRN